MRVARLFGFDPKVAFLSHSTFGKPSSRNTKHVREAIEILKKTNVDFDFDVGDAARCSFKSQIWKLILFLK